MRLPAAFLDRLRELEETYVRTDDPLRQSGFGGGGERWRAERGPILQAIPESGDLLDSCCANGYLLECLVDWGSARVAITPFGIDQGSRLIELARRRLPQFAAHFETANAWDWQPRRRFRYLYALADCVPEEYLGEWIGRLLSWVEPGGRLILGSYGSKSRTVAPLDVEGFLRSAGYRVCGAAAGGDPPVARFAWVDRCCRAV